MQKIQLQQLEYQKNNSDDRAVRYIGLFRRHCKRQLPIPCWFKDIIIIIKREMKLIFSGQRDFLRILY